MPKQCKHEGCSRNQFGGGYCQLHQRYRTDKKQKEQKPRKAIAPRSKKMQKRMKEYVPEMLEWLAEKEGCEVKLSPECNGRAECVHHTRGREGDQLTDKKDWVASCYACNTRVETHHKEAEEHNFKRTRNGPSKKRPNRAP